MDHTYWKKLVEENKDELIGKTQELLRIKSVLDEENATETAPLGEGIKEALDYMLNLGESDGFSVKNVDSLAGHIEMGEGEEIVGILCHLDVVPEGDGWSSDPFGADIREGKIFARGAIDDKGPTMAAYYAMKLVNASGIPLSKRVRMILGTDEESNWRCVERYFEVEEMPALGFAPDADFPIIYAEKGIWDFYVQQKVTETMEDGEVNVVHFESGRRFNMVPDFAKTIVSGDLNTIETKFQEYIKEHGVEGKVYQEDNQVVIEVKGISAHGMEPKKGKNAGIYLGSFLSKLSLDQQAMKFFTFIHEYLLEESRGKKLGITFTDDITGDLTVNAGTFQYSREHGGKIGLNVRYPVTYQWNENEMNLKNKLQDLEMEMATVSHSKPHHVEKDSFLIKTLSKVYEEQTGDKTELLSIGGGTYARSLQAGVAFGPLFPGREDIAHQKDEYIYIDDLLKATAIYAQAIFELAK
ncbi:dipeptidase PepV [Peribacillus alkalitolerans]|uniref:dipeptidase PepV n=1 Tax=Peribacillus alkalitolerans TaxID=1550385 RepID=UPI0013D7C105|nr:dipeptidase PepV [Peribacillus alkalitolerans]